MFGRYEVSFSCSFSTYFFYMGWYKLAHWIPAVDDVWKLVCFELGLRLTNMVCLQVGLCKHVGFYNSYSITYHLGDLRTEAGHSMNTCSVRSRNTITPPIIICNFLHFFCWSFDYCLGTYLCSALLNLAFPPRVFILLREGPETFSRAKEEPVSNYGHIFLSFFSLRDSCGRVWYHISFLWGMWNSFRLKTSK